MFGDRFTDEEEAARSAQAEQMLAQLEREITGKPAGHVAPEEAPAAGDRLAEIRADLDRIERETKARELRAQLAELEGDSAA